MKRHNLDVERLSKAREEYSKERQQRLDFVRDQRHAERTFRDLGVAMQENYKVTGQQLPPLRNPPHDFYNPSRQRKDAEVALVVGEMAIVGLVAYKFL